MAEPLELTQLRQGLYRYFGEALSPPGAARLESLDGAGQFLDEVGLNQFAFYGPWRRFADTVAATAVDLLATEYVRLFDSGVDGALCPPTESYYRGEAKGGGIAKVISDVERAYRRMGVAPPAGSETPDHAAVELEAMSALCGREAVARESGSLGQAAAALLEEDRFLRGHLAAWFPEFSERVAEAPGVERFYRTLIEAVHAFVVHEVDLVALLRRDIEGAAV
jgi:TorA maturation chaperone TorD